MAGKFLIVNNGFTAARDPLAQVALAVARAASLRGFDVLMATHTHCDVSAIPADLRTIPLFRVDHSGQTIEERSASIAPLRGELAPLVRTPIEALLKGRIRFREWFAARLIPPAIEERGLKSWFTRLTRRVLPSLVLGRFRARSRRHAGGSGRVPVQMEELLRRALSAIPSDHNEVMCYRMFAEDLERLLVLCEGSAGDHVYLPAAHGRDAVAITALVNRIGSERLPTFHLVFRHTVFSAAELECETCPRENFQARIHRAYFDVCRAYPRLPTVRFYCDNLELAATYEALTGFHFGILPSSRQPAHDLLSELLHSNQPHVGKTARVG